jgi:hypothetical protein
MFSAEIDLCKNRSQVDEDDDGDRHQERRYEEAVGGHPARQKRRRSGINVMLTFFSDLGQLSAKKLAIFSKTNVVITFAR